MKQYLRYYLLQLSALTPTEDVDEHRVIELERAILASGRWKNPIIVHREKLFVMDGHHRLTVAKRLKLIVLPAVLLDYDRVDVVAWRDGDVITPNDIFEMARYRRTFPSKTTRHIFKDAIPTCDLPLSDLKHPSLVQGMEALEIWAKHSMVPY